MDNSIYFDTAWTPCTPVIQKLAELHPGLEIDIVILNRVLHLLVWILIKMAS